MDLSSCCVTLSNDNINNTLFRSSTDHIFNSHTSPTVITSNPLLSFPRKPQSTTTRIEYIPNNKPFEVSGHQRWRTRVSFFPSFLTKGKDSESLKEELFEAIAPLDRGAEATTEDQGRVDQIARKLEAMNKTKEPLKSNLLNGKWELLYTTSTSILQTQRPKFFRANGKIYQAINLDTLRAQNMETWPFFNQATANLVPLNARRVAVKFDAFKIAGVCNIPKKNLSKCITIVWSEIPIKARGSGRGQLEITYLDEELRISRGNEGNLFILRMVDPSYRVPL